MGFDTVYNFFTREIKGRENNNQQHKTPQNLLHKKTDLQTQVTMKPKKRIVNLWLT